ncbi:hypothetical protein [Archangium sp.]|uniref:hypothetical protein n=1 Tax=Archangium sp. TaxID=1872627 RepID=UPI00389A40D6
MEVILISLVGMVLFGGLFLVLCPEWWSTSLGTLKEKPAEKTREAGDAQGPKADT